MDVTSSLKSAEIALGRGDYRYCIDLLEPIRENLIPRSKEIGEIRLLLITAYIGQGESQKAINECKLLAKGKDQKTKEKAKQLLEILDAPSLPRPENWSIKIPNIPKEDTRKYYLMKTKESKGKNNKYINQPTGPTKNLSLGFSLFTLAIFSILTFLLSGCIDITTDLEFRGPNKIQVTWDIASMSGKILPWQNQFSERIKEFSSSLQIKEKGNGAQKFISPFLREDEINALFNNAALAASTSSGFKVKAPYVNLDETNWLIGAKQHVIIVFDLTDIPNIPGLNLAIQIDPVPKKNNFESAPLKTTLQGNKLLWQLQQGALNKIDIVYWQWSYLGIGIIVIIAITIFSMLLQSIRLKLGYGFPELPP